jgi:hypothetical protein
MGVFCPNGARRSGSSGPLAARRAGRAGGGPACRCHGGATYLDHRHKELAVLAQVNIGDSFQEMLSTIINFLPLALAFLAILIIGWFVAKAIAKIVDKVLTKVGFDRAIERGGVGQAMARTEYDPSTIIAKIVFWMLFLFVLQLAFGIFGPNPISALLFGVIAFLPRLIVAIIIVVVAAAIANGVREIVAGSLGGLSYGRTLANVAAGIILVIGVFAALTQIQIAPAIVTGLFYAMLAIIAGSAIIAIGGGGIVPMRKQWEKAIDKMEDEAPRIRRAARSRDYEDLSKEELDRLAQDRDLRGRSTMTKDELAAALRHDDQTHELRQAPVDETPGRSTRSYDELTHDQLIDLAQERDLEGRSQMDKGELVEALRHDDRTHELRRS